MARPPKKSSGCGKIILIVAIVLVVIGAGVAAAVYFGYHKLEQTLKSSEAYTVAIKALKENSEVKEKLGDIEETGFPLGAFSQDASGSGKAAFTMSVKGTKGSGQYQVDLERRNSVWYLNHGYVRTASGDVIQIADPSQSDESTPSEDAPSEDTQQDRIPKDAIKGGVLNGKAITLPKPIYPPVARSAKASGTVVVQVLVDEDGDVVSAKAISGHPLLQSAAITAARQAKFTPTKVAGKPVKVSGLINYNFAPE